MLAAALLMVALVSGCAKVNIKPKGTNGHPEPASEPVAAQSAPDVETPAPRLSIATIVRRDLQNGRYAEGEAALRRYLQEHPQDRAAQFFLRQLKEDPKQALGATYSTHVVQPGESYSTLAAKYLGDPNLFVVLARYNDSTNPSLIRVGSTLRMPGSRTDKAEATAAAPAAGAKDESMTPPPASTQAATPDVPVEPPASPQRARQLEDQSLTLYRQGHHEKAVAMLDQAFTLDPQLKSSDPDFPALSREWVANSHQQAMVLYLDQHLDQAIALWNRILVVDPSYEPAVVYRTRALELKQRLQQY